MIRVSIIGLLSLGGLLAQEPPPPTPAPVAVYCATTDLREVNARLQQMMVVLDQQSQMLVALHLEIDALRQQATTPPSKTNLAKRALSVVDHAGSVASIYSVIPRFPH